MKIKPKNIAVVGQGYVGLPLTLAACGAGHKVYAIDKDLSKINLLVKGVSPLPEIESDTVKKYVNSGNLLPILDSSMLANAQIIIVCVPTPVDSNHEPDLSLLKGAILEITRYMTKGVILIIESTVAPGTIRDTILPLILKNTNLRLEEFGLAYSPERIDPGNKNWSIHNTPKLVSAINPATMHSIVEFYSTFIEQVIQCHSIEVAETAKLLENSFRLVNISLINELMKFCDGLGISIFDVISAASTKPYGFMKFYPSIGVGGHCIPVDPIYLSDKARLIGSPIKSIELASEINESIPDYFAQKIVDSFDSHQGKKILVVGISYKPNVADTRESASIKLLKKLKFLDFHVYWHDEVVKVWDGEKSAPLDGDYDLAVVGVVHDNVDLSKLVTSRIIKIGESTSSIL